MKRLIFVMAAIVTAAWAVPAADKPKEAEKPAKAEPSEKFVLYKLYDMAKNCTYEVSSASEFKKLESQLKKEGGVFDRAVALAATEYSKNKEKGDRSNFQKSLVAPRDVKEIGEFSSQEAAEKKKNAILEREAEAEKASKERDKTRPSIPGVKADPKKDAEKAKRDAERKAQAETMAAMVDTHLQELLKAQAEAAEKKNEGAPAK
jgi:hypothetical protein